MTKLYQIIAEVTKCDIKELKDESSPETIIQWDSFNGLMLLMEIEQEFDVSFTTEEIMNVKNVGDIKRHLRGHGITTP